MKTQFLHTLTARNYDALRSAIEMKFSVEDDSETLVSLQTLIDEHRALTLLVKKELAEQERKARGVFNFLETCNPLFVDHLLKDPEAKDSCEPTLSAPNHEPSDEATDAPSKKKPNRKPRLRPAKTIEHRLSPEQRVCPCCGKNMHLAHKKKEIIIRLDGFSAEEHLSETARCVTCDTKAEAEGPKEKTICNFSTMAAAGLVALRYLYGMASYRMEAVTSSFGYRIPDSTLWDLFEATADELRSFFTVLRLTAASAPVVHMDDTGVAINELSAQIKDDLVQDQNARTGVHTTGSVAVLPEGKIAIFHSGLHHAGEFFFKLMEARTTEDMVVVMSDAASANSCHFADVAVEVTEANCNSHAVRRFKESANNPAFAEHAEPILERYAEIFKIEKSLAGATPQDRLKSHKLRSLPLMEQIRNQIQEDFRRCRVEPNSELGKNYRYFVKHFTELSAFCRKPAI